MKKDWMIWMLLLGLFVPVIGCEADGEIDVDDDDAKIELDVDD